MHCQKGMRLIFLKLDVVARGNTNKLGNAGMCNWKSSLFFLTIYLPEWIIQSKGYMVGRAVHHRIVSDAHNGP